MKLYIYYTLFVIEIIGKITSQVIKTCDSKWIGGNKAVNCSQKNLMNIPDDIIIDTQVLDLSFNQLYILPENSFKQRRLVNLKKLYLNNCELDNIYENAFCELGILNILDLSFNLLEILNQNVFNNLTQLTTLNLAHNKLINLYEFHFKNLPKLQLLNFNYNQISKISSKAFVNLMSLKELKLIGNNLMTIQSEIIYPLKFLINLEIHKNPLKCDCYLEPFRKIMVERDLYVISPQCHEPRHLKNQQWNEINETSFACIPNIIEPTEDIVLNLKINDSFTLYCKVIGNPFPEINWIYNSKIINENLKYTLTKSNSEITGWANLTINSIDYYDIGDYKCEAKNLGGTKERHFKINIDFKYGINHEGDIFLLIMLLGVIIIGISILLSIIAFIVFSCNKKKEKIENNNNGQINTPNEIISNTDTICQTQQYIQNQEINSLNNKNLNSNVNNTIHKQYLIQKQLRSYIKIPRQFSETQLCSGYVTMPRNYRTNSLNNFSYHKYEEPVYDHLGIRTTVKGSSMVSLNMTGLEQYSKPYPLYRNTNNIQYLEERNQYSRSINSAPSTPTYSNKSYYFPNKTIHPKLQKSISEQPYEQYKLISNNKPENVKDIFDTPSANESLMYLTFSSRRKPKISINTTNTPLIEVEGENAIQI